MERIIQDALQGAGDLINTLIIEPFDRLVGATVDFASRAVGSVVGGTVRAMGNAAESLTASAADAAGSAVEFVRGSGMDVPQQSLAALVPPGMNVGTCSQDHAADMEFEGHNLQTGYQFFHGQSATACSL